METVNSFFSSLPSDWPILAGIMILPCVLALVIMIFIAVLVVMGVFNYLNQVGIEIMCGEAIVREHEYVPREACGTSIEPAQHFLHIEFEGEQSLMKVSKKNYKLKDGDKIKIRYGTGRLTKKPFIVSLAQ